MKKTKLLMFSGGLDSTYLLYKYVNSNEDIWVHHVILKNKQQNRWKEELKASREIISYMKKIRDFTYTESEWSMCIDENDISRMIWDGDVNAFVAGQIVPYIKSDEITLIFGRIMEDDLMQSSIDHLKYTRMVWRAATEKFRHKTLPEFETPLRFKQKRDLVKELPDELLDLIWVCLYPIDENKPCNKCKSCIQLENAKRGIFEGKVLYKPINK